MLIIPQEILEDIFDHSIQAYPEECCGILVGRDEGGNRVITESRRAKNVASERRHERYLIDEKRLVEVIKDARGLPVDVVGFYHSHPDCPSRPSEFDVETVAWPGYSYLIVSVQKDRVVSHQSWVLPDGSDAFVEEPTGTAEKA